jgi:hypothetical protein
LQRFKCRNDANLFTVLVNQPDFTNPDALIDAGLDRSGNNLPPLPYAWAASKVKTTQERAG